MNRVLALVFALSLGAGCPGGDSLALQGGQTLASVGHAVIDVDTFLSAARVRAQAAEFPRSGAGFESLRDRIVQELIVEEVLLAEARARELVLTPEELETAHAASAAILGEEGGEGELERMITERFGAAEVHDRVLRRRLLVSKVESRLRTELRNGITVTDEQVAAALQRFAPSLLQPARVHCRQIFLESADDAREARRRLASGEAFEALALEYNGADGDMGWVAESSMPPMLAKAIRGLPVGRASDLVRSPLGHHLFQLLGRSPALPLPEDEARATVERFLIDETVDTRFRSWVGTHSDDAGVEIQESTLAALRCCRQGLPYLGSES